MHLKTHSIPLKNSGEQGKSIPIEIQSSSYEHCYLPQSSEECYNIMPILRFYQREQSCSNSRDTVFSLEQETAEVFGANSYQLYLNASLCAQCDNLSSYPECSEIFYFETRMAIFRLPAKWINPLVGKFYSLKSLLTVYGFFSATNYAGLRFSFVRLTLFKCLDWKISFLRLALLRTFL